MKAKVEYTHCKSCDGTGLSPSDQFICCLSCIGQGGLYVEPTVYAALTACYCDLIHSTCSFCEENCNNHK